MKRFLVLAILLLIPIVSASEFFPQCENCDNLSVNRQVFDGGDHWRVELTFSDFNGLLYEPLPQEVSDSDLTFYGEPPSYDDKNLIWNVEGKSKVTYEIRPKLDKRVFNYYSEPHFREISTSANLTPFILLFGILIIFIYIVGILFPKKKAKKSKSADDVIKRIRAQLK